MPLQSEIVGRVAKLWRYPVQSMGGEVLASLTLGTEGPPGDRAWGIVDPADGKIRIAARNKEPWRRLVQWRARYLEEPAEGGGLARVEMQPPAGPAILSDDADRDDKLSAALGVPAGLSPRTGENQVYAFSPIHLLTSASLAAFAGAHPEGQWQAPRFRPNILVDCGDKLGFIEQGWFGARLEIGATRLLPADNCVRCLLTTLPQGALGEDRNILKTVNAVNGSHAGIYCDVARAGQIALGDPVFLIRES